MKHKIPLQRARQITESIIRELRPFCERIQVAGSIRRQKQEVGDIELLAVPKSLLDMFGQPLKDHELDVMNYDAHGIGRLLKGGHKYKQIALPEGLNLDLFIVTPPAQWGVQLTIRTGPAEFSKQFVTPKMHGGLLPNYLRVEDGAIWSSNHIIPTPEEQDVFDLLGIPYIEPEDRTV